jgi:hypothetical protein
MFFLAFTSTDASPLPSHLTFTIEQQASQILTCGDLSALRQIVNEKNLLESLFTEVEFLGSIPRGMQDEVKAYFQSHEDSLYEVVQRLLNEPENEELRKTIREPLKTDDELQSMIGTI